MAFNFNILDFAKDTIGKTKVGAQNASATSYISHFKSILTGDDATFTPANRNHFFVFFTFPTGINSLFQEQEQRELINNSGYLVRDIDAPNFTATKEALDITTPLGAQSLVENGTFGPSGRNFNLSFIDCEIPIFEKVFVPWMKQSLSPTRALTGEDAIRANVYINVYGNDAKTVQFAIKITGAFPNFVDTPKFAYGDGSNEIKVRKVGFKCNEVDIMWDNFIVPELPSTRDEGLLGTLGNYLDLTNII
jgi:hypothetical protein